jgi:hypothetical protein
MFLCLWSGLVSSELRILYNPPFKPYMLFGWRKVHIYLQFNYFLPKRSPHELYSLFRYMLHIASYAYGEYLT